MFHYKLISTLILFTSCVAFSQQHPISHKPAEHIRSHFKIELSYITWKEMVSVKGPTGSEKIYGDYIGNAIAIGYESYWSAKWGSIIDGGLLLGQANLGGSQTLVPYQESDLRWWGLKASYRATYRLSPQIITSMGPMVLGRQIDLPLSSAANEVKSGATVNHGIVADVTCLLTSTFAIRTELGGLLQEASTVWSLGIGYRF